MARISEIVVAIEAEGTEKVLAALNQVEGAQVKTVKTTKQLGAQTKEATATAGEGWATLATGINQATQIMITVVEVGKAVYDMARQSAELEFMAGKFDRLSLSIGTTSDVLLEDLRKATQGTRSDMELMASASDFMALGFAKTSDEAVRLSTVAGALNMNMNQLALTLANQTTMRFDQLGVSVVGFQEKVDALVKSGMSANAAFQEAFLRQAEEQIQKVGNAADSSLGGLMQMESAFKNLSDVIKQDFTTSIEGIAPAVTKAVNSMIELNTLGNKQAAVIQRLRQAYNDATITQAQYAQALRDLNYNGLYVAATEEDLAVATSMLNEAYAKTGATVDMAAESQIDYYIKLAQTKTLLGEIPGAANGAGDAIAAFALTSDKAAEKVDNFLAKATLFKDDFGEMFDLGNVFSQQNVDIEGLIDNLSVVMDQYSKLKTQLEDELVDAQLNLNVAISTFSESVASSLVAGLKEAGFQGEELALRLREIDAVFGTDYEMQYRVDVDTEELQALLNDPNFQDLFGPAAQAMLEKNLKLDADVSAAEAAIQSIYLQMAKLRGEANIEIKTLVDDAAVTAYVPPKPEMKVVTVVESSAVDSWTPPTKYGTVVYLPEGEGGGQAVGGPVYPDKTYLWQEPNREGELFVPEQYGRVMNNHQVAQAIREAMFASNAGGGRTGGAVTTDNSRHITYNINAQYKHEPVLTLSQHLKILSTLGGRA